MTDGFRNPGRAPAFARKAGPARATGRLDQEAFSGAGALGALVSESGWTSKTINPIKMLCNFKMINLVKTTICNLKMVQTKAITTLLI